MGKRTREQLRTWVLVALALGAFLPARAGAQEPLAPEPGAPAQTDAPKAPPGEGDRPVSSPEEPAPAVPSPAPAEPPAVGAEQQGEAEAGTAPTEAQQTEAPVEAVPEPTREEESALKAPPQVHAFVSQGFIITTDNNYLAKSEDGSFEFSEVGVNLTKTLTDRLRVGIQLFAHELGPTGNYRPQLDWAYIDYRFWDWLGLRAGRTKLPIGLYNEVNDIDAARVPILLPQSLYLLSNREFLFAQIGGELYGDIPLGGAGQLEYRAHGGTLDTTTSQPPLDGATARYLVGGRLMWRTPLEGLQVGGTAEKFRFDWTVTPTAEEIVAYQAAGYLPAGFTGVLKPHIDLWLWLASLEYQLQDLLISAEGGRTYFDVDSDMLIPKAHRVDEGFYVMASYRLASWLTPGAYYSYWRPDVHNGSGKDKDQHDVALTLRYDLTPNWLVKLEGHYMHGTAVLNSNLNDGAALDDLKKTWGALLIKTTAYF